MASPVTKGSSQLGEVYLLHFSRPLGAARHYIGWTGRTARRRLKEHRAGKGASITRAAVSEGITLRIAKVWKNVTRTFERELKNKKMGWKLCPICRAAHAARREKKRAAARRQKGKKS